MKAAPLYALLLTLVLYTDAKAQNQQTISAQGPDRMVRTITQDRDGNMWLASPGGIIRYDGKVFTNITSEVMTARFFSVIEDRKGNFWFSSIGSGVYHYDGRAFINYTTNDGLASDQVPFIYEDKSGNIWFGTDGGASRYDGKSFRNYKMNQGQGTWDKVDNDVNSIIEDKTGKFWFGTRNKAYTYDGKTFNLLTNNGKPFRNVRKIIEDKKGNIWFGGDDGLWRYDGNTFKNFTQNFVGYIYEDKNGNIWTSSQRASDERWILSRYDEKSLSDKKPIVTEINFSTRRQPRMIFGILEADDGSIWFGSLDGVYRYDGNNLTKL